MSLLSVDQFSASLLKDKNVMHFFRLVLTKVSLYVRRPAQTLVHASHTPTGTR